MRFAGAFLAIALLGACLGPGESERAFVPVMEQAASQVLLDAGATEATTRPAKADTVQWVLREHTLMVDSIWPAGRMNGKASIPVVVRFDKVDGAWTVTEAVPNSAGMAELKDRIGQAEDRSAHVKKLQNSYDARVRAAHDSFTTKAQGGGFDAVFPDIKHVEIRNCEVIATVPDTWSAQPKRVRKAQLKAIGEVWSGVNAKHKVKCADPAFRAKTPQGRALGAWSQARGASL